MWFPSSVLTKGLESLGSHVTRGTRDGLSQSGEGCYLIILLVKMK